MRRFLMTVSLAAGLAAGALGVAVPSSAASNPALVHFDIQWNGSAWSCTSSAGSVRMNPGDAVTLTLSSGSGGVSGYFTFDGVSPGASSIDVRMTTSGPSSLSPPAVGVWRLDPARSFGCNLTVTVVDEVVEPAEAHDFLQQVGVPPSGDCSDVPNWVGHLPGFPIGGWSKSWARWVNDGRGGPVCTREVLQRSDGKIVLVG